MRIRSCVISCIALLLAVNLVEKAIGQPERAFQRQLELVKQKYDLANWGPETGRVISGLAISEEVLPQLSSMKKVWREDDYSVENVQKASYTKIRKWWRRENDQFKVTLVVAPSFDAAKRYLILRYATTQRKTPLIKPPGRAFGLNIGNVCFVTEREQGEAFSSIDFIRHNVVLMMSAKGDVQKAMASMARTLDALLAKKHPIEDFKQLPDLPKVKTLSPTKASINLGEHVLLTLEVDNPKRKELHYFWTLTGGGVEKDSLERFVY